jgi:hypothetical protein
MTGVNTLGQEVAPKRLELALSLACTLAAAVLFQPA